MKKAILAAALVLPVSYAFGQSASGNTLTTQAVLSPTVTVNIATAKTIDFGATVDTVVDAKGITHTGKFSSPAVLTLSTVAGQYYKRPGTNTYYNLTQATSVPCQNNASVFNWTTFPVEIIADGCAFADGVKSYSRN